MKLYKNKFREIRKENKALKQQINHLTSILEGNDDDDIYDRTNGDDVNMHSDWEKHYDSDGHVYWYNRHTNESTWEKPF